jgi:hypothetical protein
MPISGVYKQYNPQRAAYVASMLFGIAANGLSEHVPCLFSRYFVIPVQTGIQVFQILLDTRLRGYDSLSHHHKILVCYNNDVIMIDEYSSLFTGF